jgi:AcrR family transcriptional regulator
MKTRDRILVTSLELFNEEGEAHTTTIDIANVLDISPGNLYYHFKGKDDIIAELFQQFEIALSGTLNAPLEQPLSTDQRNVEDNWYYLYVVMEEMYHYRFFYQNLDDILLRYDDIRRRFRRLVQLKKTTLQSICDTLIRQSVLRLDQGQLTALVENLTLVLTFWFSWNDLLHGPRAPRVIIHQGVLQMMTMIAPYLGDEQLNFYHECRHLYERMLEDSP